jgi:hypothetical protein
MNHTWHTFSKTYRQISRRESLQMKYIHQTEIPTVKFDDLSVWPPHMLVASAFHNLVHKLPLISMDALANESWSARIMSKSAKSIQRAGGTPIK